ncbi:MAG: DNA repair protein RecO [Acidobacteria bacterium OLB17]|nr:MAG: DNA repair protein RecO [Acidobacteria bacterium OLB17]MCZ2389581.1 DNA repair protein RecO [Acidobacteriota bacterium]
MAVVETECIVLRSYDLADADKIAVLLTADHGIVKAVAKGAKRLKSKFGSGLEPLSRVNAVYFKKETRELVDLDKAEVLESAFDLISSPEVLTQFSYLTDILISLVPAEDPDPAIFRMMNASLGAVRKSPDSLDAVSVYFEAWLLRLAGFFPSWDSCSICKISFREEEAAQIGAEFQLICVRCRKSAGGDTLTAGDREVIARSRRQSPAAFASESIPPETLAKLSAIFKRMIGRATGFDKIDRALHAGVRVPR